MADIINGNFDSNIEGWTLNGAGSAQWNSFNGGSAKIITAGDRTYTYLSQTYTITGNLHGTLWNEGWVGDMGVNRIAVLVDNVEIGSIENRNCCLIEVSSTINLSSYIGRTGEVRLYAWKTVYGNTNVYFDNIYEIPLPNIIVTDITPSTITCTEPCNLTVDVTWTNNGGATGTFTPTITVNTTPYSLSVQSLDPGLSVTNTFTMTGLIAGSYNICPVQAVSSFERVSGLLTDKILLRSPVIDPSSDSAYFGYSGIAGVMKIRLSDLTEVGTLNFITGTNMGETDAGVIDTSNGFTYYAVKDTNDIHKIRLSDFTIVSTLNVTTIGSIQCGEIDVPNGFAYFGTNASPGRIVKIRLSDFTHVDTLTLSIDTLNNLNTMSITDGFLYIGCSNGNGTVVKINLSTFTEDSHVDIGSPNYIVSSCVDNNGFGYFGGGNTDFGLAAVWKFRLSDLTPIDTITNPISSFWYGGSIDLSRGYAYFCSNANVPFYVLRVKLSDFTFDSINSSPDEAFGICSTIDINNGFLYVGTNTDPGRIVKFKIGESLPCITVTVLTPAPANIISAILTVDKNDCVEPCTVNGTVSWTNTGGVASSLTDLSITYNGSSIPIASGVIIGPGETLSYMFTIPDLTVGTYTVQASPNVGTIPQTITVRTPANIVATAIVPSTTACTEPCDLTVDVTWTNTGGVSGTFIPSIKINGNSISPAQFSSESLDPGASITHTFIVTGLSENIYTICPDPDTGVTCAIITVEKVVQAGFGTVGILFLGGLLIGTLLFKKKCEDHKTREECEKTGCLWENGKCIERK